MADFSFTVTIENGTGPGDLTGLANVIAAIDQGGADAGIGNTYTITLGASITLSGDLPAINLDAGCTVSVLGGTHAIDGAGAFRGLLVFAGAVTLQDLTIQNAHAQGGNGGFAEEGGGGGAGLGGGLFVAGTNIVNGTTLTGGSVTLRNVSFANDSATGGDGGGNTLYGGSSSYGYYGRNGGGGGGMGGNGGHGGRATVTVYSTATQGGGGGLGRGADGGSGNSSAGSAGALPNTYSPSGGGTGVGGAAGGANGGGGGSGSYGNLTQAPGAGGGGLGASSGSGSAGGTGGFGGGGGGGYSPGGNGGFGGGGGGAGGWRGGNGGFGGGGGASAYFGGGNGGFGAGPGAGGSSGGGGGGGLGAGGAIFVQQGGTLIFQSGSIATGAVAGGLGSDRGGNGSGFGAGMFIQGDQGVTFAPPSGQTVTISSTIADMAGSPVFFNAGVGSLVVAGAGTLRLDAADTYTGGTMIDGGGTLDLGVVGAAGSGNIGFAGSGDTLKIETGVTVANTVATVQKNDVIDAVGFQTGNATFDPATHVLTIADSGGSLALTLDSGSYLPAAFVSSVDAAGTGLAVTYLACFAAGTRIATDPRIRPGDGDVAIERLRVGQLVRTLFAGTAPVVWLGHRHIDCRRHPDPMKVWPICVRAGAFGDAMPVRDLLLSPDHAVYVDGVLVPVRYLVNGSSIVQQACDAIDYWHVELPAHDVLLAEGLPAESFLDTGGKANFANGGCGVALHPDFVSLKWEAGGCAPLLVSGARLTAIRARIAAAIRTARPPEWGWRSRRESSAGSR